jgi:hypothetical protein
VFFQLQILQVIWEFYHNHVTTLAHFVFQGQEAESAGKREQRGVGVAWVGCGGEDAVSSPRESRELDILLSWFPNPFIYIYSFILIWEFGFRLWE